MRWGEYKTPLDILIEDKLQLGLWLLHMMKAEAQIQCLVWGEQCVTLLGTVLSFTEQCTRCLPEYSLYVVKQCDHSPGYWVRTW